MAYLLNFDYDSISGQSSNTVNTYCCQFRTELESLRSERDKAVLEADFARDRLNGFAAELEHQVLFLCCNIIFSS